MTPEENLRKILGDSIADKAIRDTQGKIGSIQNLRELAESHGPNPTYEQLVAELYMACNTLDRHGGRHNEECFTNTGVWEYEMLRGSDNLPGTHGTDPCIMHVPERVFKGNPPVNAYEKTNDVLMVGLWREGSRIDEVLDQLSTGAEIPSDDEEQVKYDIDYPNTKESLRVRRVNATYSFWPVFFDTAFYLDEEGAIPGVIYSGDYMRTYRETLNASQNKETISGVFTRMQEIGERYDIPVKLIQEVLELKP